jgi:5-methyltetrahydrofolate--homocysteine methyltransferase
VVDAPGVSFLAAIRERVLVFDGAMGTSLHALELPLSDYNGLENCSEILSDTRPDAIERIHRSYLEVGCDAVETNTFGGMKHVLAEFGLAGRCHELNVKSAQIARRAVEAFSTAEWPRFVVGSIGPGTKLISLRQIDYDTMLDSYFEQVRGLLDGGCDVLLIETCQDILQTKVAIEAVRRAWDRCGRRTPLMCQVTMETTGTMLMGTEIAAALTALETFPEVDVIGLNCATGPQEMSEHVRYLGKYCTRPISVMPNAGLPQVVDGKPHFPLAPEEMARWLKDFVEQDGVSIVGGCCGTTPVHLAAVVQALRPGRTDELRTAKDELRNARTRAIRDSQTHSAPFALGGSVSPKARSPLHEPACSSLYSSTPYRQDNSFLIVGERCNTNGSKKFKELLAAGDVEGMLEAANEQIREGAHVLDVCVDYVGRDGVPDMKLVVNRFASDVTVPLMLDSTEPDVIEAGLKLAGGKCIVNSVNLEDGEQKMARVCRLLRQYGAAVVALTIDEDPVEAMGKTAARKLAIATRIYDLLTCKYGIAEEDIFFDCLTFPITTGNPEDRRLALETLDAIEALTKRYPRVQTILGVSNVSFGLQPAARAVLNSAFLHEACERGLTAAIVHAGKILPRNKISTERWEAALDLIYARRADDRADPLERFIGLFAAGESLGEKVKMAALPVEERLKQRIIDGARIGLEADLDEALRQYAPLHIVNTFLLDGMKVVGELFGSGQMQLPFVLKSAEAMKAAVAYLEPHMEKLGGQSRGKMVLATVRGDVHDIGKNLVDIILSNNGYTVYNLGIKQPINNVIHAWREHNADAIGLSGLLVKSTLVMRDDLAVLNEHGIAAPVVLGGAALTRKYVEEDLRKIYKGPLFYAKDAFDGLRLMEKIASGQAAAAAAAPPAEAELVAAAVPAVETVETRAEAPAPTLQRRSLEKLSAEIEQRYGLREVEEEEAELAEPPAAGDTVAATARSAHAASLRPRSDIGHEHPVPRPPFWGSRVVEQIPLKAVLGYINETMLFQVQWGFRKKGRTSEQWKRFVNSEIRPHYRELVERCEREAILRPQAIYGYWPANSDGDDLIVFAPPGGALDRPEQHGEAIARFTFPRQRKHPYWCLADFWRPVADSVPDVAAFSLVTVGRQVSEAARQWFAENKYQQYLFLHGLGVETAEALAEYIHKQIRMELGVSGQDARELQMLFKQGYQGSRYSFGYPACPRLEDQAILMKLLEGERIGVTLSEEYQLDPEQSTSALIAYHPAARYFSVR